MSLWKVKTWQQQWSNPHFNKTDKTEMKLNMVATVQNCRILKDVCLKIMNHMWLSLSLYINKEWLRDYISFFISDFPTWCVSSLRLSGLYLLLLFMSMEWDCVSELPPPMGLLFIPQTIYEYGVPVQLYWQGTTEEFGEKSVPVPICPP
jgi:hypothetical protein